MSILVNGKNNLEGIVGIEVNDNIAEIFLANGDVVIASNRRWILSNESHGRDWVKLDGSLHYQYGKTYKEDKYYYGDKKALKDADIFTIADPKESFMVRSGHTYFKNLQPKDLSVLSFDIETTGLKHDENSKILIISNTFRKNGNTIRHMFTFDEYETQGELLMSWCAWVRNLNPDIIVGHNIYTYDLPYMAFIASCEGIAMHLGKDVSPIKFFPYESFKRIDGNRKQAYNKCRIFGREVIDTMFLSINYDVSHKYESYALKKIIAHEGLEVANRQFYDAATIKDNYTNSEEWNKIKAYAEHDADDSLALYDLMAPAFFYLTQSVPKSFQSIIEGASGSQINSMMIRSYLQIGHSLPKATDVMPFEGAISWGGPGIYKNVIKWDVASLYPSIMIEYNIYDKVKDPKAHMSEILKIFTEQRLRYKKLAKETGLKYYDDMQAAGKICINSMFGFMGAPGLNFNYVEGAALVTKYGREILNKAIEWSTGKTYEQWNI